MSSATHREANGAVGKDAPLVETNLAPWLDRNREIAKEFINRIKKGGEMGGNEARDDGLRNENRNSVVQPLILPDSIAKLAVASFLDSSPN